jgi:type II secretory pathway pseudopilin PulG
MHGLSTKLTKDTSLEGGFTLMEIVVSTTIFATTLVLLMSLFTYTLKINRRTEALRQSTQGMRNFMEFLGKEIRNGKIDYAAVASECTGPYASTGGAFLGIVNVDGKKECFYLSGNLIMLKKASLAGEALNPNSGGATVPFQVTYLKFYVRPTTDPYTTTPNIQPFVTIDANFRTVLPTGETVNIPYQTSVSTDVYDIPSS